MILCRLARGLAAVAIMGGLLLVQADGLGRDLAAKASRSKERQHWSFQPIRRPAVPAVGDPSWVQTPVDAFVLARLEKEGLRPNPPADRRTLLRRVYLDLIGLPPTPAEQQAFLQDRSPDAYAKVVEDLLSRPQYGERWARHWLDVVRYAESNGYERDGAKPHAWRYRDYVIDSFNQDKPYDRFLTEQLAGDELSDTNAEAQIATTFLRLGTWDDEPADPAVDRYDQLDDVLGTTASAFLGVTLRCARCHDHKFEPFSQVDYYRLLAAFEPLKRPQADRKELDRPVGTKAELAAYEGATKRADAEVAALQKQIESLKKSIRDRLFGQTAAGGEGESTRARVSLPAEAVAAFQTEPARRTPQQKDLVKKYSGKVEEGIRAAATSAEHAQWDGWEKQIAASNARRPTPLPRAYIWYEDGPKTPVTRVLRRGNPTQAGATVEPGVPAVLARQQPEPPRAAPSSTGRRLWLARWMTAPDNPLVARVLVNRLWQHHFGKGLVGTANDFGVMGEPPSHPALLDWLGSEFIANGSRLKPLHRLLVLSSTYQMSAAELALPPAAKARDAKRRGPSLDAGNHLLWRWQPRRLEAEAVRDSILAVSGQLNRQMAGPSIFPPVPAPVLQGQSRPGDGWGKSDERQAARRSIYIFVKRSLAVPELELFDAPDTTSSCEQRPVSTTAPQALTFLNGDFANQQAWHFAARLEREAGKDLKAQVQRAFELALCRSPKPEELSAALDFLAAQQRQIEAERVECAVPTKLAGAQSAPYAASANTRVGDGAREAGAAKRKALQAFCLVLSNTNEFVYLE